MPVSNPLLEWSKADFRYAAIEECNRQWREQRLAIIASAREQLVAAAERLGVSFNSTWSKGAEDLQASLVDVVIEHFVESDPQEAYEYDGPDRTDD